MTLDVITDSACGMSTLVTEKNFMLRFLVSAAIAVDAIRRELLARRPKR